MDHAADGWAQLHGRSLCLTRRILETGAVRHRHPSPIIAGDDRGEPRAPPSRSADNCQRSTFEEWLVGRAIVDVHSWTHVAQGQILAVRVADSPNSFADDPQGRVMETEIDLSSLSGLVLASYKPGAVDGHLSASQTVRDSA
jgi:hypothetical protein